MIAILLGLLNVLFLWAVVDTIIYTVAVIFSKGPEQVEWILRLGGPGIWAVQWLDHHIEWI